MTISVQLNGTAHCQIEVPEDTPELDIRRRGLIAIRKHFNWMAQPWRIQSILYEPVKAVNVITNL